MLFYTNEFVSSYVLILVKKAAFHIDNQDLLEKVEHILRRSRVDLTRGIDQQSIAVLSSILKGIFPGGRYQSLLVVSVHIHRKSFLIQK